jgi:hypothetical protein
MKETLNAVLAILQEVRRDTKAASILILFGLVFGLGYIIFILVEEKNDIAETCELELKTCQAKRFQELKETQTQLFIAISKIDSLNRLKRTNSKK